MEWLSKNRILTTLLIIAALVRFWNWPDLQFHHDELSALLRTEYSSLSELISKGVWIDGHPAFTQVFLWLWISLVGFDPMMVKLPFMIAGVISVFLVFSISANLFNKKAAYVSTSLMAIMQYSIIYSQWARPYSFGLLFMLGAFNFLICFKQDDDKLSLLGFAVLTALAAYTHYFALLQIIVLSALWFLFSLNNKQRMWFLLASIVAFVFWLPHLRITLHHLSLGGIGDWLKPPSDDFWSQLIGFSFHYSWLFAFPIAFAGLAYLFRLRIQRSRLRIQMLLAGAWVIPYVIAYVYSLQVSALMHFGTMLFTFPFLVIVSGSFFADFNKGMSKISSLFILVVGLFTLINREHFHLNTKTEFQDPIQWHQSLPEPEVVKALFDLRSDAVSFMSRHGIENMDQVQLVEPLLKSGEFTNYLRDLDAEAILLVTNAATSHEVLSQAAWYYPYLEEINCYQAATAYLLVRIPVTTETVIAVKQMNQDLSNLDYGDALKIYPFDSNGLYNIFVRAEWFGLAPDQAKLVLDWKSNDSVSQWQAMPLTGPLKNDTNHITAIGIDFRDLPHYEKGGELTTYVWNGDKEKILVDWMKVSQFPSNPLRYGLFKPIK